MEKKEEKGRGNKAGRPRQNTGGQYQYKSGIYEPRQQ
jgi:hypothetical protein